MFLDKEGLEKKIMLHCLPFALCCRADHFFSSLPLSLSLIQLSI